MQLRNMIGFVGAICLILGLAAGSLAADDKANATGTWKYSVNINDQARESTIKLKQEGDKLTGTVTSGFNNQEAKIEDGKVKDGEVSFKVVRDFNGQKITIKYSGKLSADTIKGKMEIEVEGQPMSRDWEAKRAKDSK